MNRSELVAAVAEHTGHTQAAVNGGLSMTSALRYCCYKF